MTRRSRLLTTATAGATAALLLAGCGGGSGDKSDSNSKIAGADTGASASASPSASASTASDGRPKITLPSDVTLTFEGAKTGDAVKDAVLADNAEMMRAVDAAIAGTDPKAEGVGYYTTGKALGASLSWVAQWKKANVTITGDIRYYDRNVTLKGKTAAILTFCGDESKGFSKNKKTNKINKTPVTKNSYVTYNTRLDKNSDGVWQTSQIISTRGAARCQP